MRLNLNEAEAALLACAIEDAEVLYRDNRDQLRDQGASAAAVENATRQHKMMVAISDRLARTRQGVAA